MSILIKGMDVPSNCDLCIFDNGVNCMVYPPSEDMIYDIADGRPNWCPLVSIPPHGRLIDADAFLAEQRHLYCENCERRKGMKNGKMKFVYDIGDAPCRACGYGDVLYDIEDAPTIIEAEVDE